MLGEQLREHRRTFPRFSASAAAVGCGPIIEGQPLTARQEAYLRELEAFEYSGVLPAWERRAAVLDARRLELHDRALAGGLEEAPADLLDLLEDQRTQHQNVSAPAEPPTDAGSTRGPEREEGRERIRNDTDHRASRLLDESPLRNGRATSPRVPPSQVLRANDVPLDLIGNVGFSVVLAVSVKLATWRH